MSKAALAVTIAAHCMSLFPTGAVEKLPAYAAERMLTASGLASALADRPTRQLEQLCTGPANAVGRH